MTDLEITKLCAEAMGWKHLGAVGVKPPKRGEKDPKGLWCLSGGNDWWRAPDGHEICGICYAIPDPIHDDAQAMALEDWLLKQGAVLQFSKNWMTLWQTDGHDKQTPYQGPESRRRFVCECVAKIRLEGKV